jgi:sulfite exporter TauE/SafE
LGSAFDVDDGRCSGEGFVGTSAIIALVVGLLSATHCVGMCGGIVGALGFSLPGATRRRPGRFLIFTLAYNAGRVLSYSLAGMLLGALGGVVAIHSTGIGLLLRVLAALITMAIGLHVMGVSPWLAAMERFGEPLWRRIEPFGRRLLPVRSLGRAFGFGVVWGWLPCGLVYAMLLNAPAQGGALGGGLYMALFGLGTLPVMVGSGLLVTGFRGLLGRCELALFGGALVVALGLYSLLSIGI